MSTTPPPAPSGPIPLTIGQTLDRIFLLFRRSFFVFLRIASVPAAGMILVYAIIGASLWAFGGIPTPGHPPDPLRMMAVLFPSVFIGGLVLMLVYTIFEAAGIYTALLANLGVKVSFREAYRFALEKMGRFLWLSILRSLWVGLPILVCYVLIGGLMIWLFPRGANASPTPLFFLVPLMVLAYLGAMVYAILMGLRLALTAPACVAENVPAAIALRRSVALTRNAKGRIFLVLLVLYAAGYLAFMIFEVVCFALGAAGMLVGVVLHLSLVWAAIGIGLMILIVLIAMFLWIAALSATYAIAFAVLYHDQRLRTEGVLPLPLTGEPA